ncbi:MAG: acetyl-CoA carboxylase biotin carboxyl carrier protein subunit, partial [Pseudomonadota bacterium]
DRLRHGSSPSSSRTSGAPASTWSPEAMKMEHILKAERDGTVAEIMVASGDQVEAGAPLVRLEEGEEP